MNISFIFGTFKKNHLIFCTCCNSPEVMFQETLPFRDANICKWSKQQVYFKIIREGAVGRSIDEIKWPQVENNAGDGYTGGSLYYPIFVCLKFFITLLKKNWLGIKSYNFIFWIMLRAILKIIQRIHLNGLIQ